MPFLPGFVGGPPPVPLTYPYIADSTVTAQSTTSSTHVANLPADIQAGDIILVLVSCGAFTVAATGYTVGAALQIQWLWKIADGSEAGGTMTVTGITTPQKTISVSMSIRGQTGNTPQLPSNTVGGGYTGGVAANPNPPNLNISFGAKQNLLITVANWTINGTPITPSGFPSGYTQLINGVTSGSGTNQRMYVLWRQAAVASEDPSAYTAASSGYTVETGAIEGAP